MPETKSFFIRINDTEDGEIETMLRALAAADLRSLGDETKFLIRRAHEARFPSPAASVSAETAIERPADPAVYQVGREG